MEKGPLGMADASQQGTQEGRAGVAGAPRETPKTPETPDEVKARKEREKDELYALDISEVAWRSAPGTEEHAERVEIAELTGGAVAMRSSLDPGTVLRYTEAEWTAFVLGARDGEFDLEGAPGASADGG